jgi:hypothetical protein
MKPEISVFAILLCAAVIFAGCTGTTGSSGTTAAGATGAYAGSSSSEGSIATSPTDVVPEQNAITITVGEKDYLGKIPVTFQGGTGQIHVKNIEVTAYLADGQTRTGNVGINKGDSAEIQGTKQTDRVIVYVSFDNGQRLKTNDVQSPYRTRA